MRETKVKFIYLSGNIFVFLVRTSGIIALSRAGFFLFKTIKKSVDTHKSWKWFDTSSNARLQHTTNLSRASAAYYALKGG